MTPSERLLERLRAQGMEIPEGSQIHRTYAGWHQRAAGAWSWFILGPDGHDLGPHGRGLGSYYPVKVCLRAPRLTVTEEHRDLGVNIDPDPLPVLPGERVPRSGTAAAAPPRRPPPTTPATPTTTRAPTPTSPTNREAPS